MSIYWNILKARKVSVRMFQISIIPCKDIFDGLKRVRSSKHFAKSGKTFICEICCPKKWESCEVSVYIGSSSLNFLRRTNRAILFERIFDSFNRSILLITKLISLICFSFLKAWDKNLRHDSSHKLICFKFWWRVNGRLLWIKFEFGWIFDIGRFSNAFKNEWRVLTCCWELCKMFRSVDIELFC